MLVLDLIHPATGAACAGPMLFGCIPLRVNLPLGCVTNNGRRDVLLMLRTDIAHLVAPAMADACTLAALATYRREADIKVDIERGGVRVNISSPKNLRPVDIGSEAATYVIGLSGSDRRMVNGADIGGYIMFAHGVEALERMAAFWRALSGGDAPRPAQVNAKEVHVKHGGTKTVFKAPRTPDEIAALADIFGHGSSAFCH